MSGVAGNEEQLVFVASQPGVSWSPAERGLSFVYVTVTNQGPGAIQAYWDGDAPSFKTPPNATTPGPTSPQDQFIPLFPGNSITLAVARAIKLVFAPGIGPQGLGDYARGQYCLTACCPTFGGVVAAQPAPTTHESPTG